VGVGDHVETVSPVQSPVPKNLLAGLRGLFGKVPTPHNGRLIRSLVWTSSVPQAVNKQQPQSHKNNVSDAPQAKARENTVAI